MSSFFITEQEPNSADEAHTAGGHEGGNSTPEDYEDHARQDLSTPEEINPRNNQNNKQLATINQPTKPKTNKNKLPAEHANVKQGTSFWVAEPSLICRAGPELETPETSDPCGRNRIVYCAGKLVQLPNGIVRMPITKTDDRLHEKLSNLQRQKLVHWVTLDASSVDWRKKHMLVEVGDELLFFKVFLMQKYAAKDTAASNAGTPAGGFSADGGAEQDLDLLKQSSLSTSAWYAFYRDMDRNNNNLVSMIEFEAGLLSLKYPDESTDASSRKRRKKLLQLLDKDGSGELTFEEFGQVLGFSEKEIYKAKDDYQKKNLGKDGVNRNIRWSATEEFDFHARIKEYGRRSRSTTPSQRHSKKIYTDESVRKKHMRMISASDMSPVPLLPGGRVSKSASSSRSRTNLSSAGTGTNKSMTNQSLTDESTQQGGGTTLQDHAFPEMEQQDGRGTNYNRFSNDNMQQGQQSAGQHSQHMKKSSSAGTTNSAPSTRQQQLSSAGGGANSATTGNNAMELIPLQEDQQMTMISETTTIINRSATAPTKTTAEEPPKEFDYAAFKKKQQAPSTAPTTLTDTKNQNNPGFSRKSHIVDHPKRWTNRYGHVDPKTPKQFRDSFDGFGLFSTEHLIMQQEWKIPPGTGEDDFSQSKWRSSGAPPNWVDPKKALQKKKDNMIIEMKLFRDFLESKYGAYGYEGMERIFKMMDTNSSDRLGVSAFTAALQSTLKYPDDGSISFNAQRRRVNLFLIMDLDGMGSLDRYEFCRGLTQQLDAGVNLDEKFTRRLQRWGNEKSKWVLLAKGAKNLKKPPRKTWHDSLSIVKPENPVSYLANVGLSGGNSTSVQANSEELARAQRANAFINVRKKLEPIYSRPGTMGNSGCATSFGPPRPTTSPDLSQLFNILPKSSKDSSGDSNRGVLSALMNASKPKMSEKSFLADEHSLMPATTGDAEDDDEVSDMLKNLQKRFLQQEHVREERKSRALSETVDFAEMMCRSANSNAIAQMSSVANFGVQISS
ncbi:unnamed protein product [Amoebophrya sp. A120]|nr:unnamed protein product [Amoebophrya sp. A120]|eukprot:GSA120T00014414001.1